MNIESPGALTECPDCKDETFFDGVCENGCYGLRCSSCDEVPDPPEETIEVVVSGLFYMDLCIECFNHEPGAVKTA